MSAGSDPLAANAVTTATITDGAVTSPKIAASPTLVTPNIGVATGSSLLVNGTSGIGYSAGAGGAVTQLTGRSTTVTVNTICGTITGMATSLAAGAEAVFQVTNSRVALRDVVAISLVSGSTVATSIFVVSAVAAGSFKIRIRNVGTVADIIAPVINFAVIKAVNA